ncbi:MAG: triose-phosphate isomerase [Alphaproteobacteria bacterium]|nr:triose-phosphate isomerase [Alphaproteobacteria bacterium]
MAAEKRRPLVAGNWKMNGLKASEAELRKVLAGAAQVLSGADLTVCPPATLLRAFAAAAEGSGVAIGAQDCHAEASGAFTGDLSAEMLADAGAVAVIVGHSERRTLHGETDVQVRAKAAAAWRAKLTAIVCIGETRAEREAGRTLDVLARQIDGSLPDGVTPANVVVAYEPVWAIGTGLTPTLADVAEAHGFIRGRLATRHGEGNRLVRVLYGGSVKPSNASELMAVADVDGALVGGASLKAEEFLAIAGAYRGGRS